MKVLAPSGFKSSRQDTTNRQHFGDDGRSEQVERVQDCLSPCLRGGGQSGFVIDIIFSAISSAELVVWRCQRVSSPDCDNGASNAPVTTKLPGHTSRRSPSSCGYSPTPIRARLE